MFDKEKTEKRPGNVGDYACERYFYDVDFDALKREKMEQDSDFEFDPEMERIMQTIDLQLIHLPCLSSSLGQGLLEDKRCCMKQL